MGNIPTDLNLILLLARQQEASDVHLCANNPLVFRKQGQLLTVSEEVLSAKKAEDLIRNALPLETVKIFDTTGDTEYVHSIPNQGRFRMSLMKQRDGWDLTVRLIPMRIPSPEEIGLTQHCLNLTKWAQGMVLVTGPAGCGKTTTLSSLVDVVNGHRADHIITIESPIEIVYKPNKCQITQREVGMHTMSQSNALRAALREDPDILVVSELRDLKTIQLAISAAETGHLVFGTMNTVNAGQTISKLIDSFPADEQGIMRNMISESLRGVICQQLVPKKDGKGMVPAFEVLIVNHSVGSMIREGKISQLNNVMTTGKSYGMQLMDNSLQTLAVNGIIEKSEALDRAINPAMMIAMIGK